MQHVWTFYPTPCIQWNLNEFNAFNEISSLWLMGIKYNSSCFWVWGTIQLCSNCSIPGSVSICPTAFPPMRVQFVFSQRLGGTPRRALHLLSPCLLALCCQFWLSWPLQVSISDSLTQGAYWALLGLPFFVLVWILSSWQKERIRKESVSRSVTSNSLQPHGL